MFIRVQGFLGPWQLFQIQHPELEIVEHLGAKFGAGDTSTSGLLPLQCGLQHAKVMGLILVGASWGFGGSPTGVSTLDQLSTELAAGLFLEDPSPEPWK